MNPVQFAYSVGRARGLGHEWLQIIQRRTRAPKNWDRVEVIPGVYGRCVGETDRGRFLIDVRIDEVEEALELPTNGEEEKNG